MSVETFAPVKQEALSAEQYSKYLDTAIEEAKRFSSEAYVGALPISQRDKARLYEDSMRIKKHGRPVKNNPFA